MNISCSRIVTAALGIVLSQSSLAAQVTISTPPPPRQIGMFNSTGNGTFGQSVVAPNGINSLDEFSFWLNPHDNPNIFNPALQFKAYVMGWDALSEHASGSVLWSSATQTGPGFYTFNTGGVLVAPGQNYVLFLSAVELLDQMQGTQYGLLMGYGYNDYTAGSFVFKYGDTGLNTLSTSVWTHDGGCATCDAAFIAKFSDRPSLVTPEPSSTTLIAIGLLVLAIIAGKRRHQTGQIVVD